VAKKGLKMAVQAFIYLTKTHKKRPKNGLNFNKKTAKKPKSETG
jgi:hypothetical protein